jgi:hypothetical protein
MASRAASSQSSAVRITTPARSFPVVAIALHTDRY